MNQSNQSKQVLLSVIGVAILVVAVVGVSFAFFNYTRTGTANNISTGKIKFNSIQTGAINLTNVFPLRSGQLSTDVGNHAEITVSIKGETTYVDGLDWKVSATEVNFSGDPENANARALPVSVAVSFAQGTGDDAGVIGTSRSSLTGTGDEYVLYQYTSGTQLANDNVLAEGHIDKTANIDDFTGHRYSGVLTIQAYLDADRIAITDTDVNDPAFDGGTNGTTGDGLGTWVNNRVRLTTDEWNSLASHPLTFKVKVESRETGGTWVS